MTRNDTQRFQDILRAIEKCGRYLERTSIANDAELTEIIEDAIERNLQIIGEAASRLSPTVTEAHPEIPWAAIKGFRNIMVHEYFGVDIRIIQDVVENYLPQLKQAISDCSILKQ
ncbi:putative toxin-antitoxin system, antitoxin component [Mobiluncus mulieris 28-1]|uniref:Toxin-antitoxin system, antitoxin component n=2 Tax=Mobiluncus mulieris TaxID=2052 RepID=E0QQD5_9ACTO|nr:HepT-like ribonuclease domain-containing protein [Mobiluncus mulieris]EEZ91774.1 putative toxin-antitoxin system, antitoxin component [Mobiluncus mulieris 28-1]EFM46238.1 putative toxin-antitoxin system, antitoxin component [Mobiluncus mulieris ATCC 35239]EFN92590.1 putative toxin-antitoxin system, antitoxin component [Mobiluncus mulieris FB024-16]MCU9970553.1 DUF86 domain-containing protein [Mobiluncus mulieris]MCU9975463.1 DUF86 domain-containing protein [Mobiluncus mulieris]